MTTTHYEPCDYVEHHAEFPDFIAACLDRTADMAGYEDLLTHLLTCPTCTASVAEVIEMIRWREREAPFNQLALPEAAIDFPFGPHARNIEWHPT